MLAADFEGLGVLNPDITDLAGMRPLARISNKVWLWMSANEKGTRWPTGGSERGAKP